MSGHNRLCSSALKVHRAVDFGVDFFFFVCLELHHLTPARQQQHQQHPIPDIQMRRSRDLRWIRAHSYPNEPRSGPESAQKAQTPTPPFPSPPPHRSPNVCTSCHREDATDEVNSECLTRAEKMRRRRRKIRTEIPSAWINTFGYFISKRGGGGG